MVGILMFFVCENTSLPFQILALDNKKCTEKLHHNEIKNKIIYIKNYKINILPIK